MLIMQLKFYISKMKQLLSLFFLMGLVYSCTGQEGKTRTEKGSVEKKVIGPQLYDPYFAETKDTVLAKGPYTITRNILQDKKGNYWFASWQGIISYDGKTYINHTLKSNLIHFHMFSLLEAKNGDLWFGSIRGGVYRYDGKTWTLFTTANGLPDNLFDCIAEDKNGNIWFGTDAGISCYDGKQFKNYSTKDGLCGNSVHTIAVDKNGSVWIGTWEGVSIYNGKTFTTLLYENKQPFVNVRSIIEDKKGNIWIGSKDGLFCVDPRVPAGLGRIITKHASNFIGYVFEDSAGNLWLSAGEPSVSDGTWSHQKNSMVLYYYNGKAFTTIVNKPQVFGIMEDKNGIIWFGTPDGAHTFDPKGLKPSER